MADQQTSLQEFVELVRQGKMMAAIKYARGYLSPWASAYLPELQVCVHYRHQLARIGFNEMHQQHARVVMYVQHHAPRNGPHCMFLPAVQHYIQTYIPNCTCVILHTVIRDAV